MDKLNTTETLPCSSKAHNGDSNLKDDPGKSVKLYRAPFLYYAWVP